MTLPPPFLALLRAQARVPQLKAISSRSLEEAGQEDCPPMIRYPGTVSMPFDITLTMSPVRAPLPLG
ncbi:MAG: hypothetical protein KF804_14680 [Burkholderiales bacterium]|nr:hypothetical protein [Burkholderiales bacterium]